MPTELISIIVPVFNLEHELSRCLDSILAQTYDHIEVLVVDDGSRDGSEAVIRRYAERDHRVKPFFQRNAGVTAARLHGVAEAAGAWIGFVDGDDEIEPDMYEKLLQNALNNQADISHCGYRLCFPDGRVHFFHNTGRFVKQDNKTGLKDLLAGSLVEPGLCNKLFRKTLFQGLLHNSLMDLSVKINEDLLMNYYLFREARLSVFEDWCPYHYIVRGTSASRAPLNIHKIYDPIRVKEIIRQTAPVEIAHDAQRAYLNTCVNIYHTLLRESIEFETHRVKIRALLAEEQNRFSLLGTKRRLMAEMLVKAPGLYRPLYTVYCRFFQKNVYT